MYDTVGGNSEKIKKTELIIFILVWVKKFSTQFDHWTKPDKNNTSYLYWKGKAKQYSPLGWTGNV